MAADQFENLSLNCRSLREKQKRKIYSTGYNRNNTTYFLEETFKKNGVENFT